MIREGGEVWALGVNRSSDGRTPKTVGAETPGSGDYRVYADPYREVQWQTVLRLRTQLHDHSGIDTVRIKANDRAGYHVLGLQQYSGVPSLPYTVRQRLWPPERVLPPSFRDRLTNIQRLIPNAEEVGRDHLTSPLMEAYIEKWESSGGQPEPGRHYSSTQEAISLIRAHGGIAFLAHPWQPPSVYQGLNGYTGMEIYNAYGAVKRREGVVAGNPDLNGALMELWDGFLSRGLRVYGIAVNDHYGPDSGLKLDDPLRDSGKTIVYAADTTLEAFRTALAGGAFVAVQDMGIPKNQYPDIRAIRAVDSQISIETDGNVTWISQGTVIASGPVLEVASLRTRYVRAEIRGDDGSVVYTQPFSLSPIGDIDGDGDVDGRDRRERHHHGERGDRSGRSHRRIGALRDRPA